MNKIQWAAFRIQKRYSNSILARYSKKGELTESSDVVMVGQVRLSREEWDKMNNVQRARLYLANRERMELTESLLIIMKSFW